MLATHDLNISPAKITFRLRFMVDDYTVEHQATSRGHVKGMRDLDSALGQLLDQLTGEKECAELILTNAVGDTLSCMDDLGICDDWLAEMLVSAEIISIDPYNFSGDA